MEIGYYFSPLITEIKEETYKLLYFNQIQFLAQEHPYTTADTAKKQTKKRKFHLENFTY